MSDNSQNPSEFSASFANTREIAKELLGRLGNVDNYNPVYTFLRWLSDTSQDHTVFPAYFEQNHLDDVWSIWRQFQKNLESQTTTAKLTAFLPDAKNEVIEILSNWLVKNRSPEARYIVSKESELALTYMENHDLKQKVVSQEAIIKEQAQRIAALDNQLNLQECATNANTSDKQITNKITGFRREIGNLKVIIADINATVQLQDARITELEQNTTTLTIKAKEANVSDVSISQAIIRVLQKYIYLSHSSLRQEVALFVDCDQVSYDRVIDTLQRTGEISITTYHAYYTDPTMMKRLLSILNDIFKTTGPRIKMYEIYTELEKRSNTKLDYVVAYVSVFCWKGLIASTNKEAGAVTSISIMEVADQEKINALIA